jgi:hypothetical protein
MRLSLLVAVLFSAAGAVGQHVDVFARGLEDASALAVLEDGTVLVGRPMLHDVIALRDRDGDGRADDMRTAVLGLAHPSSLAVQGKTLFIASPRDVVAAERRPDGSFGGTRDVLDTGGTIGVAPDGKLFVASSGTLRQLEGADYLRIYARGLRGLTGFAWHPKTAELWTSRAQRIEEGARYDVELSPAAVLFDREGRLIEVTPSKITRDGKELAAPPDAKLTGAAIATDGALLVSDASGTIYRIGDRTASMTSSSAEPAPQPVLSKAFRATLARANAVVHDEEQDIYFVGTARGIARVSPEGKVEPFIEEVPADALAIRGTELWSASGNTIRVFDRVTGAAKNTIEVKGATALRGLAVGRDDLVYVTDRGARGTNNGRIYRVQSDGEAELLIRGEELRAPSGIAFDDLRFLVAQSFGREVLAWTPGAETKAVARGPGAFEGLVVLPTGTLLVSSQHDDTIYFAPPAGGDMRPLLTRSSAPAAIGFDRKRNRLLIPSPDDDSLEAWTLPPLDAAAAPPSETAKNPTRAASLGEAPASPPAGSAASRRRPSTAGADACAPAGETPAFLTTSPRPALSAAGSPGRSSTSR